MMLLVSCFAFVVSYYALGLEASRSFAGAGTLIFRLLVLGDVNLKEMMGSDLTYSEDDNGTLVEDAIAKDKFYYTALVVALIATVSVTLVELNLSVAVLSESYRSECALGEAICFILDIMLRRVHLSILS